MTVTVVSSSRGNPFVQLDDALGCGFSAARQLAAVTRKYWFWVVIS